MPELADPRHEAFARARARGALLIDAYERAGFVRHRGHPSRLACKPEVAERIAELRQLLTYLDDTAPTGLLFSLRHIIKAGEASENPTLVNAARLAIVDAARLRDELERRRDAEGQDIINRFKSLTENEGGKSAPKAAAERPIPPSEAPADAPSAPRERPVSAQGAPNGLPISAPPAPLNLPDLSIRARPAQQSPLPARARAARQPAAH